MSKMYIRVKKDGFIYKYDEILAKNPDCEIIPEEIAYPERFVKPEVVEEVVKTRKKRGYGLTLDTRDVPEEPEYANTEVNEDASRKLP
jgi:hypothetical protein